MKQKEESEIIKNRKTFLFGSLLIQAGKPK